MLFNLGHDDAVRAREMESFLLSDVYRYYYLLLSSQLNDMLGSL